MRFGFVNIADIKSRADSPGREEAVADNPWLHVTHFH